MKIRLAIAVIAALFIGLVPGCRDFIAEEYQEARKESTEAQAKVAELEAELEAVQERVTEIQQELDASREDDTPVDEPEIDTSQDKITELETELEKWRTGVYPEEEPAPEPPTPLQREDFRYRGFDNRIVSIHMTMLDAIWDNNKLTVQWELENTGTRKIYITLLAVKAHDQMGLRGERHADDTVTEEAVRIYPTLQDNIDTPWPGEKVRFTTAWEFGPRSTEITVDFLLMSSGSTVPEYIDGELLPTFTVYR